MKKLILIFFAISFSFISSCKKDDSNSAENVEAHMTKGNWRVTLFKEDVNDETSHFSDYTFTFNTDHSILATPSTGTGLNGTWNTDVDDSKKKFILDFGRQPVLLELNEDWEVLHSDANKLELQHVSGGNGGTDVLTFEKN